jgi:outer membrane biosynthesis protein TonB
MKISLHIEADTAAEFQQALDVLHAARATNLAAGLIKEGWNPAVSAQQEPKPAKPAPIPMPAPAPAEPPAPTPVPEEQPPVAAEAPVKARRGRPRKETPAEETTTPAETATVPPVTAPVQAATAPSGNGTGAATRQDLLDVFAEYVQRYGANFGYTDISGLLQKHIGEGVRKASDVPETSLGQAIAAIRAAILENPFNRKRDYA